MALFSRILVALAGLMSLVSAIQHWFRVESLVNERGIQAIGDIGRANVRADVGGIFLGIALFALLAAWTRSRIWLSATLLLVGSALLGRFVSVALDGYSPRTGSPMIVEAVVIGILLFADWSWRKKPEGL
jgi:hypothetical protein